MRASLITAAVALTGCASVAPASSSPPSGPWRMVLTPAYDPGSRTTIGWLREDDLNRHPGGINRVWTLKLDEVTGAATYWLTDYDCTSMSRVREVAHLEQVGGAWVRVAEADEWWDIIPHTSFRWRVDHVCGEAEARTTAADVEAAKAEEAALRARWAASRG